MAVHDGGAITGRTIFRKALPPNAVERVPVFGEVAPFLTVGWDIHNWMFAYILAPEHPYAAIVDQHGNFRIDDVPPGTNSLTAWHPKLGKRKATVTVPARGVAKVEFDFGS